MPATSAGWSDAAVNWLVEEKEKLEADLVAKDKDIVKKTEEHARLKCEIKKLKVVCIEESHIFVTLLVVFVLGLFIGYTCPNRPHLIAPDVSPAEDFKGHYEEAQRIILEKDNELQIKQNELEKERTSKWFHLIANFVLMLLLLVIARYYAWRKKEEVLKEAKSLKAKGIPWMEAEMDRLCVKSDLCEATFIKLFQSMMALEVREDRQSVKGELQKLEELYWNASKNVDECITKNVKAVEDKLKDTAEVLTKTYTSKNDAKEEEKVKNVEAREENVQEQETQNKEEGTRVEVKKGNEKHNGMEICDCCQTQNQTSLSAERRMKESMEACGRIMEKWMEAHG